MLACTETITLVRCDGTSYEQETVEGVSWYDKYQLSSGDKSLDPQHTCQIRIPKSSIPTMFPQAGDFVVRGAMSEAVTSIADLKGRTYCKVMTVSDNRRGSLPHIGLVGE